MTFTIKKRAGSTRSISAGAVFGLVLAGALAGCSSILPAPPVRADVYDFGPGLTAYAPGDRRAPLPPIALADVTVGGVPEGSTALLYRLAYANDRQLRPYAQARWSQPPAQLVQQSLRDVLGQRRAVLLGDDGIAQQVATGRQPAVLRVELEEFSQVFSARDTSAGLVRVRVSLADASPSGEKLLAQRVFVAQRPAASADAAGGAHALADATAQIGQDVAVWLEQAQR